MIFTYNARILSFSIYVVVGSLIAECAVAEDVQSLGKRIVAGYPATSDGERACISDFFDTSLAYLREAGETEDIGHAIIAGGYVCEGVWDGAAAMNVACNMLLALGASGAAESVCGEDPEKNADHWRYLASKHPDLARKLAR